jgi:hypothetical protein
MPKQANQARHDAKVPAAVAPDPDYSAAVAAARPQAKELLAESRDDRNGDAVAAAVAKGKEPSPEEIIEKISAAIGLTGPLIPRVKTGAHADAWNSRVGSKESKAGG